MFFGFFFSEWHFILKSARIHFQKLSQFFRHLRLTWNIFYCSVRKWVFASIKTMNRLKPGKVSRSKTFKAPWTFEKYPVVSQGFTCVSCSSCFSRWMTSCCSFGKQIFKGISLVSLKLTFLSEIITLPPSLFQQELREWAASVLRLSKKLPRFFRSYSQKGRYVLRGVISQSKCSCSILAVRVYP